MKTEINNNRKRDNISDSFKFSFVSEGDSEVLFSYIQYLNCNTDKIIYNLMVSKTKYAFGVKQIYKDIGSSCKK